MKKIITLLSVVVLLPLWIHSAHSISHPKEKKTILGNQYITETFKVGGTCYMCKVRIEESLDGVDGVKKASYDLKKKELKVVFNPKVITLKSIKVKIAKAGHDTDTIKANQSTYDSLHFCCKYKSLK